LHVFLVHSSTSDSAKSLVLRFTSFKREKRPTEPPNLLSSPNMQLFTYKQYYILSIRGQSKKIPNFFLNLLLYLQLNQTCLLQSTPLYCWYTAPSGFFQFWNASWNVFCGMARRSCSEFSFISSTVWNRRPFRVDFNYENRKKSAGAKSGQ